MFWSTASISCLVLWSVLSAPCEDKLGTPRLEVVDWCNFDFMCNNYKTTHRIMKPNQRIERITEVPPPWGNAAVRYSMIPAGVGVSFFHSVHQSVWDRVPSGMRQLPWDWSEFLQQNIYEGKQFQMWLSRTLVMGCSTGEFREVDCDKGIWTYFCIRASMMGLHTPSQFSGVQGPRKGVGHCNRSGNNSTVTAKWLSCERRTTFILMQMHVTIRYDRWATNPWVRSRVWVRLGSGLASGKVWVGTWPITRFDPI